MANTEGKHSTYQVNLPGVFSIKFSPGCTVL